MQRRTAALILCASTLAACGPRVPSIDLSGMTLPKLEIFRYGVENTDTSTEPYRLTPQDLAAVKSQFSAAFTDGRSLEFGPVSARRKRDGDLAICGLVSVRRPDTRETGMKLFDGSAEFDSLGNLHFTPSRLADANAKPIDIYGSCRDQGVI